MTSETNRREFVQGAGLAAPVLFAAASPLAAAAAQPQARPAPRTMGARFRALMNAEPLICPGAYDLMSARLCEVHGFKAVFVGSSSPNQEFLGMPDQALVTVSEIIDYNSVIAANVNIPCQRMWTILAPRLNVYRFAKQPTVPASAARLICRSTAPLPMPFRVSCPRLG
jgi:hypothetical protein